ncbi:MAG TPA: P-loop NTPase [Solirubrobacteraceae bacterium]|jgi:capsular exopolysaccharide synthesis family protein|nr:P-loop NTPase [Solirubrobacteraceae bacterium]
MVALVMVAAAVGYSVKRAPTYEATGELLLTPLPQDDRVFQGLQVVRDSNDPARTAQTAATLIDSPQAELLTAQRLGGDWTRTKVHTAVSVQPQGGSNVLAITAKASSGVLAARVANEFTTAALAARQRLLSTQAAPIIAQLKTSTSQTDRDRLSQLQPVLRGQDPNLSISQSAVVPSSPSGPAKWLVGVLALIAGLALGSGAALLMELVSQRVHDGDEVVSIFPLPVLAHVPRLPRRARRRRQKSLVMPPAVREAYRTLQVQLDTQLSLPRVIMLTSASTGDGKTTAATSLSLALAASGHRVVLMDFDLRKPDVDRVMGITATHGLVSLLTSEMSLADILVPAPDLPPLTVALAGTGEGDALLLGALVARMPQIMAEARELAEYVIVDTAPLGEVSDALRLLPHVDDILVVSRPDNTQRPNLEHLRDLLARSGRDPLGLVIVGETQRRPSGYYVYGQPTSGRKRLRASSTR